MRKSILQTTEGNNKPFKSAAMLLAVGIGVFLYGSLTSLAETSTLMDKIGHLNEGMDAEATKAGISASGGLASWFIIYRKLKAKRRRLRIIKIAGVILIVVGLAGILPQIVH